MICILKPIYLDRIVSKEVFNRVVGIRGRNTLLTTSKKKAAKNNKYKSHHISICIYVLGRALNLPSGLRSDFAYVP